MKLRWKNHVSDVLFSVLCLSVCWRPSSFVSVLCTMYCYMKLQSPNASEYPLCYFYHVFNRFKKPISNDLLCLKFLYLFIFHSFIHQTAIKKLQENDQVESIFQNVTVILLL
jgi:hypothetical protein